MGRLIDLTGKRFGRLLVKERDMEHKKHTCWICVCDCGNITSVNASSLTRGLTKSCGCLARETTSRIRSKDISGMKYGFVEVLERVESPENKADKKVYYKCLCECGNVFVTERSRLISGTTKSCGCYKSKMTHERFFKDLTGNKYGRLTVISLQSRENGTPKWNCICECGKELVVSGKSLKSGFTKSCGCLKEESSRKEKKHGKAKSRLYRIYNHIKGRCLNTSDNHYPLYGGRGISICDEWQGENGFINFYNWSMENGYSDKLTIDRIDNNGNYSPENCRWVNNEVQSNNRRNNRKLTAFGETHTIAEWSRLKGVGSSTILQRLKRGDTPEDSLRQVIK